MRDLPEHIHDKYNTIIRRSRNLRGFHDHLRTAGPIEYIDTTRIGDEGKLKVVWENGDWYETTFASYSVLILYIQRKHSLKGTPFSINGEPSGTL
jgi:hypothetical protein